jgi:hypothetical protein
MTGRAAEIDAAGAAHSPPFGGRRGWVALTADALASRRRGASVLGALTVVLAALASAGSATAFPDLARVNPECVARVDRVALQAMNRTNPLGQMQIFGSPAVFDPHYLRVEVNVLGARTEIYAVDVAIDDACKVISASTRLESNEWPAR